MSKIKIRRNISQSDVICSHAAILFRQKGFAAASMRELAQSIGIEASSLYNHISGKDELLEKICITVADELLRACNKAIEQKLTPVKMLESAIRAHIKITRSNTAAMFVANNEGRFLKGEALNLFLTKRKEYENALAQIIKQGIHAGDIRDTHPNIAALTILAALRSYDDMKRHTAYISNRLFDSSIILQLIKGLKK